MRLVLFILVLFCIFAERVDTRKRSCLVIHCLVSLPPSFTKMPKKQAVFIPGEAIVLPCKVNAWPTAK